MYVAKSYNIFLFEMSLQSDSDTFPNFNLFINLDLVICLKATCSNILQANTVSSICAAFTSL